MIPSARVITPMVPVTPLPAVGAVPPLADKAGQVVRHPAVQVLVSAVSFLKMYSVILLASTRKFPSVVFAVDTLMVVVVIGVTAPAVGVGPEAVAVAAIGVAVIATPVAVAAIGVAVMAEPVAVAAAVVGEAAVVGAWVSVGAVVLLAVVLVAAAATVAVGELALVVG